MTDSTAARSIPPVLVLVFNRERCARAQLEELRQVRPSRLFISADGPRPGNPDDEDACRRTRAVFDEVDWPCTVHRNEYPANVGLNEAALGGVTWFFEQVDAGVILEDDTIVHPDFFRFSAELLERYKDDPRIRHITSVNVADHRSFSKDSYFFASTGQLWGWATWADRWRAIDRELSDWPLVRERFTAPEASRVQRAHVNIFDSAFENRRRSWVRIWYFNVMRNGGLVTTPTRNMLRNIGLGPDATHTTSRRHTLARLRPRPMVWPLVHPIEITPNERYDNELAWYRIHNLQRRIRDTLRNFRLI